VTSFGLFVLLDELYVEGLIHITELGGEYYRFDEVRQELRGERTGIRYATGARVRVQVSRVDLDGRKIDFRLVRDGLDAESRVRSRVVRDKTGQVAEPETAVAALDEVRRKDRQAKAGRKSSGAAGTAGKGKSAAAHPVKAARSTARQSAGKGAAKTAAGTGEARGRKRR
jgi:ribonuclease R